MAGFSEAGPALTRGPYWSSGAAERVIALSTCCFPELEIAKRGRRDAVLVRTLALGPPEKSSSPLPGGLAFRPPTPFRWRELRWHSIPSRGTGYALSEQEQALPWPWGSWAARLQSVPSEAGSGSEDAARV